MKNPKITNWQGKRVWLIGASTGIGENLAVLLSQKGAQIAVSSRSYEKLFAMVSKHALLSAIIVPCDVTALHSISHAHQELLKIWSAIDVVIYLAGDYVPILSSHFDEIALSKALRMVDINLQGAMRVWSVVGQSINRGGGIAWVASVAGYRALPKALAYGASKAGLIYFAETLHLEQVHPAGKGIGVWVVNPGFVDTPLTHQNDFQMPDIISAEQAAKDTLKGLASGCFEIRYPQRFTLILKLLRILPSAWYFALVRALVK